MVLQSRESKRPTRHQPSFVALALGLGLTLLALPAADALADDVSESAVVAKIGRFRSPTRIALDDDGLLYVSDTTRGQVALYDQQGVRQGTIKGAERPLGVAILETQVLSTHKKKTKTKKHKYIDKTYVYVADDAEGSVKIFDQGQLIGRLGEGPAELAKPNGVAAFEDRVYVVDSAEDRVAIYDRDGAFLDQFGTTGSDDGQFDFPTDIAIDHFSAEVYVADLRNHRVQVFDLAGAWQRTITAPPNDSGDPIFINPAGIGLDPLGNLYVVDNALCCVVVLDPFGELLDVFGYHDGAYWTGELTLPIDAASNGVSVFVTSNEEGHVNVFEVTP
jgi:DNA-binding beta-propeller fold protein YncE